MDPSKVAELKTKIEERKQLKNQLRSASTKDEKAAIYEKVVAVRGEIKALKA